jgi:hypothetical protein
LEFVGKCFVKLEYKNYRNVLIEDENLHCCD